MAKMMMVLRKQDGTIIAINKATIAVVEPHKNGCKIITNLLTSPYEGQVTNVVYYVQEDAQFIIGTMNN